DTWPFWNGDSPQADYLCGMLWDTLVVQPHSCQRLLPFATQATKADRLCLAPNGLAAMSSRLRCTYEILLATFTWTEACHEPAAAAIPAASSMVGRTTRRAHDCRATTSLAPANWSRPLPLVQHSPVAHRAVFSLSFDA